MGWDEGGLEGSEGWLGGKGYAGTSVATQRNAEKIPSTLVAVVALVLAGICFHFRGWIFWLTVGSVGSVLTVYQCTMVQADRRLPFLKKREGKIMARY